MDHSIYAESSGENKPEKPRWSLIPALTFAGLLSAIFCMSIWYPAIARGGDRLFVILASLSLGLALGTVLCVYRLIQTWITFVAVIGVTVAVHLLELYSEPHLPVSWQEWMDVPGGGSIKPEVAATSFAVALILFAAIMLLTTPRAKMGWVGVFAFVCASLDAATVTAVDGTQRGAWITLLGGKELELLWQLCLMFFLAIALAFKGRNNRFHGRVAEKPGSSFLIRFGAVGIAVLYWTAAATWAHSFQVREGKRIRELQARQKIELSKSRAEAPSLENLAAPAPKPLDQVLLLQDINGWKPYFSGAQDYPAQRNSGDMMAPVPERRMYYARYATPGDSSAVAVNVTEYPNVEWAKYVVRDTPTPHEFINHPDWIKHLFRFGNNLFQEGPYFFWPSGDRLIMLDCQGVLPDVIDGFLQAYLEKYPSSVQVQE